MPLALFAALVASIGAHALALFLPDVDLSTAPAPPVVAEIRPVAALTPVAPPAPAKARPKPPRAAKQAVPAAAPAPAPAPVASDEGHLTSGGEVGGGDEGAALDQGTAAEQGAAAEAATAVGQALPAQGTIRYRVYRGTQGLEVGRSTHSWQIADGSYRIDALTETSGLAAFFKPLAIELASRGRIDAAGYHPYSFVIRRNGQETRERAEFDWAAGMVQIGDKPAEPLADGAQDLLSFHYQLAFLPQLAGSAVVPLSLPIATGKKFERYRLQALGDEEITTPAGVFQTLHLIAPGDNTTELWLARERWLLPVKIRHTDRHGGSFEQLADVIQTSSD